MPVTAICSVCGRALDVPNATASRTANCSQCNSAIPIAARIYDAEEIPIGEQSGTDEEICVLELEADDNNIVEVSVLEPEAPSNVPTGDPMAFLKALEPPPPDGRRRCPACRELILVKAVKCRFCGTALDAIADKSVHGSPNKVELSYLERDLLKRYRSGIYWIVVFNALMVLVGFGITLFYAASPNSSENAPEIVLFYGFFTGLWLVCVIFCVRNQLWAAYLAGGICVIDFFWTIALWNPFGTIICGFMIWTATNVTSRGRQLNQRGIDLSRRP